MAQLISSFVQTRIPEPLAVRSTDSASSQTNENATDFGSHLAAEKPVQRSVSAEQPQVRGARKHANRDIEDVRREAARDAGPVVARATEAVKVVQSPQAKPHTTPTCDVGAESPKDSPKKTAVATCDKPEMPIKVKAADGGTKPKVNPICEKAAEDIPVDKEVSTTPPTEPVQELTPEAVQETPVLAQLMPEPAADPLLALAEAGTPSLVETIPVATPFVQAQQAPTQAPAQAQAVAALVIAPPAAPEGQTSSGNADEGVTATTGIVSGEAALKSSVSVPLAGVRDRIASFDAAALAKPDLAGNADKSPVDVQDPAITQDLAGKKSSPPGEALALNASASGKEGAAPREVAPRHAFADLMNEFANAQGALHRSGDLVGSLDRAVAGQPPAAGGADALRPTPLQVLPIEIGMQAARGATRFQIRLDPAELGRVDVQLDIRDNGEVRANLVVDRVETLAILKRDAQTLQYAFEQAGLKQAADGLTFSLRGEGQNNQNAQRDGGQQRRQGESAEPTSVPNAQIAEFAMRRVMIPNSSVDRVV